MQPIRGQRRWLLPGEGERKSEVACGGEGSVLVLRSAEVSGRRRLGALSTWVSLSGRHCFLPAGLGVWESSEGAGWSSLPRFPSLRAPGSGPPQGAGRGSLAVSGLGRPARRLPQVGGPWAASCWGAQAAGPALPQGGRVRDTSEWQGLRTASG